MNSPFSSFPAWSSNWILFCKYLSVFQTITLQIWTSNMFAFFKNWSIFIHVRIPYTFEFSVLRHKFLVYSMEVHLNPVSDSCSSAFEPRYQEIRLCMNILDHEGVVQYNMYLERKSHVSKPFQPNYSRWIPFLLIQFQSVHSWLQHSHIAL